MAGDMLADLFVNLRAKTDEWKSGLSGASSEGESFGSHIGSTFGKVAGLVAGLGISVSAVSFFKTGIEEAREAAKTSADIANTLKITGASAWTSVGQVDKLSTSLSNYSAMNQDVIAHGEDVLLSFNNVKNAGTGVNAVFDRGSKVAVDLSAKLGTNLQGSMKLVGKALQDPVKGMTALNKVGAGLSTQQQDLVKHLVATGDSLGAQKVILTALEGKYGGAAGALADPWDKFKVTIQNVEREVGEKFLPIINKLIGWAADLLPKALSVASDAFGWVSKGVKNFIDGFKFGSDLNGLPGMNSSVWAEWGDKVFLVFDTAREFVREFFDGFNGTSKSAAVTQTTWIRFGQTFRQVWTTVKADAQAAWAVLSPIFAKIGDYLGNHIKPILISVGAAFGVLAAGGVLSLVVSAISAVIGVVVALVSVLATPVVVIGLLIAALVYAYTQFAGFRNVVNTVVEWLVANVPPAFEAVRHAAETAFKWIQENVVPIVTQVVTWVITQFGNLVSWVVTEWPKISEAIGHVMVVIRDIIGVVVLAIAFIWEHAHTQIMAIAEATWSTIQAVISAAVEIVKDIINFVLDVINGDWDKAWHDITDIFSTVWGLIITVAGNFLTILWNLFVGALQILAAIVGNGLMAVLGWFASLPGSILGALGDLGGLLIWAGLSVISGLKNGAVAAAEGLWGWLRSIGGAVVGVFWDAGSWLLNIGSQIIDGLVSGIRSAFHKVTDVLGSLSGLIPSWKGPPARDAVMLVGAGQMIMGGLVKGLKSGYGDVQDFLGGVSTDISGMSGATLRVAPLATRNSQTVTQVVTVRHEFGDTPIKVDGTKVDTDALAKDMARSMRAEFLKLGNYGTVLGGR